jgi:hypothetical protein
MTAITADFANEQNLPPALARALEALVAIRSQRGASAAAAWARGAPDEATRIAALAVLGQVPLALNLFADLERARQSRNPRKLDKVNKRLDRPLERLGGE